MRTYVAFDLGLSLAEVSNVTYHPARDDPPDDVFTWRVVCDQGQVTITTRENKQVVEVGRATWTKRKLTQRWCKAEGYPNDYQWKMVSDALGAHDVAGAPGGGGGAPRRLGGDARRARARSAKPVVTIAVGAAVLAFGIVVFLSVRPSPSSSTPSKTEISVSRRSTSSPAPPPPPEPIEIRVAKATSLDDAIELARPALANAPTTGTELLARYAVPKLRWDDVATATTSVGLVLKDASIERGKRLCATGTIGAIERSDLEQRAVYRGTLDTTDGDDIEFLAVGSTGTLVRRDQGTLCGVVLGKQGTTVQLLGMFDLPENRAPAVEREVPSR